MKKQLLALIALLTFAGSAHAVVNIKQIVNNSDAHMILFNGENKGNSFYIAPKSTINTDLWISQKTGSENQLFLAAARARIWDRDYRVWASDEVNVGCQVTPVGAGQVQIFVAGSQPNLPPAGARALLEVGANQNVRLIINANCTVTFEKI